MEARKIGALVQDDKNFNKGTERGMQLMEFSLSKFGAARSVVIDKNDRIIAGNKTVLTAQKVGIDDVLVIESTGDEIVAVKRTDLDLDSEEGRELALADNVTSKENLNLDYNAIRECVNDVHMDTEIWGIKDLDKLIEKSNKEKEKEQKKVLRNSTKMSKASITPIRFHGYNFTPTQEEYDDLLEAIEDYFNENGVLIGFIGELLGV